MTIHKDKVIFERKHSRHNGGILSILKTLFLLSVFGSGLIVLLFGFPFSAFRNLRVTDMAILAATAHCGLYVYGQRKEKKGYNDGFLEAFMLRNEHSA